LLFELLFFVRVGVFFSLKSAARSEVVPNLKPDKAAAREVVKTRLIFCRRPCSSRPLCDVPVRVVVQDEQPKVMNKQTNKQHKQEHGKEGAEMKRKKSDP
jgi:hypothetical protein